MTEDYQRKYSLEKRKKDTADIVAKYPDKIPVFVDLIRKTLPGIELEKNKYIVPKDITVIQFIYVLRERLKIPQEKALFLFIGKTLHPTSESLGKIYEQFKDQDGLLYCRLEGENTFGYSYPNL